MKKILKRVDSFSAIIFFTIVFLCIILTPIYFQNDTFYTIRIGQFIRKNGIDFVDHYSFHQNLPYSYPHWLYDVFVSVVYDIGNFLGLYIMNIILYIILCLIFYNICKKITKNRLFSFMYTIFFVVISQHYITTRAQQISFILFALFVYFLELYIRKKNTKYLLYLMILSTLVANVHCAVWPFLFILILPYFGEVLILKIVKKFNNTIPISKRIIKFTNINLKNVFIVFALCFICGLFTPLRGEPYFYLIKTMLGKSMQYINEHQPIVLIHEKYTCAFLAICLIYLIFSNCKFKFREIFMIIGLTLVALSSMKNNILLYLIGGIYFMFWIRRFINKYDKNNITSNLIINIFNKKILVTLFFIIFGLYTSNYLHNNKINLGGYEYTTEVSSWINENLEKDKIRLFNGYVEGSYLLFDEIPVFIDTRADLYTKEFNKKNLSIMVDFFEMNFEELDEKYNFTHYLVQKNNYLSSKLDSSKLYNKIYENEEYILYEKND